MKRLTMLIAGSGLCFFAGHAVMTAAVKHAPSARDHGYPLDAPFSVLEGQSREASGGIKDALRLRNPFARAEAVYRIASSPISESQMAGLMDACAADPLARRIVMSVWASVAPGHAAEYVREHVARGWWEEAEILFTTWAETDPQQALAACQECHFPIGDTVSGKILAIALENGYDDVLDLAQRMLPMALQRMTVSDESLSDCVFDEATGRRFLNETPYSAFHERVIKRYGELYPEPALDWLGRYRGPSDPSGETFRKYYTEQPEQALRYLEKQAPDVQAKLLAHVGALMSERDQIEDSVGWIDQNLTGRYRTDALSSLLGEFADSNPAAAMAQLGALSNSRERRRQSGKILERWFESDQTEAIAYMATMPAEDLPSYGTFYESWRKADLEGAAEYVRKSPAQTDLTRLTTAVAQGFAENRRWLDGVRWMEQLTPGRMQQSVEPLLGGMNAVEIGEVVQSVETLPGDVRFQAHAVMLEQWLVEAPEAAIVWLKDRGNRELIDQAIGVVREMDAAPGQRSQLLHELGAEERVQ